MAVNVERLAISLGYSAFIREEKDNRPRVTTINYVVSIHRQHHRTLRANAYAHPVSKKAYGDNWRIDTYDGVVYCATVPGGLLHVRGKKSTSGFWSGNSNLAGVDARAAWGTRYGRDGRLYQLMRNRRTGKTQWISSEDLDGKVLSIPD